MPPLGRVYCRICGYRLQVGPSYWTACWPTIEEQNQPCAVWDHQPITLEEAKRQIMHHLMEEQ